MNEHLLNLMTESGYASPYLATRAQELAELIIQDCVNLLEAYPEAQLLIQQRYETRTN